MLILLGLGMEVYNRKVSHQVLDYMVMPSVSELRRLLDLNSRTDKGTVVCHKFNVGIASADLFPFS